MTQNTFKVSINVLYQEAKSADAAFGAAMGGNRWQPIQTEAQLAAYARKLAADKLWRDAFRALDS